MKRTVTKVTTLKVTCWYSHKARRDSDGLHYNHCTEGDFYYRQNVQLKYVSEGVNVIDAIRPKYEQQQIRTSGQ